MKQSSFLPNLRLDHGGDIAKGRRKTARPFSHRNAIHVVMRSTKAKGAWSLLTRANARIVNDLIAACAAKHHIAIYRQVNVGNHLHLLIKAKRRQYAQAKQDFHRFLKQLAGEIAFQITGARKGKGMKYGRAPGEKGDSQGGFWEKRVYSRIVTWGREYNGLKDYLAKNFMESVGLWWGDKHGWLGPVVKSLTEAGVGPPG